MKKLKIIIKKLRAHNGESMSETLFALLIIALALIMLPGAVVSASKVNYATKQSTLFTSLDAKQDVAASKVVLTITQSKSGEGVGASEEVDGVTVQGYLDKKGAIEFYRFGY